ncbi:hypothetical protein [Chlorogloea sp. CCALA 695]|uniref:hypothetical protein n=1 Tax=Chlorogloea sp. CCALA 695 TaxID=2107693 RepID=UPI003511B236
MDSNRWQKYQRNGYRTQNGYQNFVSLVSVYSHQQGVVLAAQQFESNKSGELKVVQTILEALQLEGVVFTMDALHCQKNY